MAHAASETLTGLHAKQYSGGLVVATYANSLPHCLHAAALRVPRATCRFRSRAAYRHRSLQNRCFPDVCQKLPWHHAQITRNSSDQGETLTGGAGEEFPGRSTSPGSGTSLPWRARRAAPPFPRPRRRLEG
jgi:hypothetical protein